MGNKCCSDRKDGPVRAAPSKNAPSDESSMFDWMQGRESFANKAGKNMSPYSRYYISRGDDAEKFDKAFESNDLKTFVQLLNSSQPIESFEEPMHPWAQDPKTVGALAGTQLAILASGKDKPAIKDEIYEAGAIKPLVDFLKSDQEDRVGVAVVALSFLTAECTPIVEAVYEAGGLNLLLKQIDSPVGGMRAAAATSLRNIAMEKEEYREQFVQLGGIKGLVDQLSTLPAPGLDHADVQLESVLNVQDLIETRDGQVIDRYALEAIRCGAEAKLKQLTLAEDQDVCSSAEEVLAELGTVKRDVKVFCVFEESDDVVVRDLVGVERCRVPMVDMSRPISGHALRQQISRHMYVMDVFLDGQLIANKDVVTNLNSVTITEVVVSPE